MNDWNKLVKEVYNKNKHRAGYFFKHALKDAKKMYKGGATMKNRKSRKSSRKTRRNN